MDHFVLLLPQANQEQFLTAAELQEFLRRLLEEYPQLRDPDLLHYSDPIQQVQRLLDTTWSLEITPGEIVQWYATRLHKS